MRADRSLRASADAEAPTGSRRTGTRTDAGRWAKWVGAAVCAVLLLVLGTAPAHAGTSGRIAGRVTDAKKQPLAGVNVGMIGVQLGALTDEQGQFTIVNIPAGAYSVRAGLIGYGSVTTTNVIVSADETTRLDLVLAEAAVQMQEVVVSAKRPVVEIHRTSTVSIVPREDIAKLPVQELQDVVNLQAGVVDGHFRGGRANEVQYQVDGVSVNNPFDNSNSVRLDRSLLEEVQVVSGTFDAEYGQAMSGVVNAVLRRGGERFAWDAEALSGGHVYSGGARGQPFHSSAFAKQDYQITVSGPVGLPRTTFLANTSWHHNDGAYYGERRFTSARGPGGSPIAKSFLPDGDGERIPLSRSREWSSLLKVSTRAFEGKEVAYQFLVNAVDSRNVTWSQHLTPDAGTRVRRLSVAHGLSFTHTLSPKRYYQIDLRQNYTDSRDMAFDDVNDPRYYQWGAPAGWVSYEFGNSVQGVSLFRDRTTTNMFVGKGTFVEQVSHAQQWKAGLEYQAPLMNFGAPGKLAETSLAGGGFGVTQVEALQSEFLPVFVAGYVQDQLDWNDVTLRIGVRGDWFDARATLPSDLANPANSIVGVPQSHPEATSNKFNLSPRVGISYPMSERAALYFAYGHFYQYPAFRDIFNNADYSVLRDIQSSDAVNRKGILGNPDIRAQHTVQYQIGLKQAVTPDLGVDFNAFYKDIRDLLGVEFVNTYNNATYVRFTNVDYGSVIGLTLQVDHRALGPFNVSADYTWQRAIGNSSEPSETLNRAAAGQDALPRQIPLNWDQRHTLNMTLSTTHSSGLTTGLVLRGASGQPYTPSVVAAQTLLANSGRKPMGLQADLRAEFPSRVGGIPANLFARVFNAFDSRYFNGFVFATTGQPDYSRSPTVDAGTLDDPTRFFGPRRLEVGITLKPEKQ
ncbi:MAG: TonB-dependent receptor [Candidatus Eisenbacteria bacterium]